jgi:hypothetical protein
MVLGMTESAFVAAVVVAMVLYLSHIATLILRLDQLWVLLPVFVAAFCMTLWASGQARAKETG